MVQAGIQVGICEDDPKQAELLSKHIKELPGGADFRIILLDCGEKLLSAMETKNIEIVLMDINLGAENGIALTRQINRLYPGVQIVYITGFMPYCTEVYETEHAYFLTKPVEVQLLAQAMQRAVSRLNCIRPEFVCLHIASGLRRIPVREILYMESEGRKLLIHTTEETLVLYGKISEMEWSGLFVRCHKSYLVNMGAVERLNPKNFLLKGGVVVPVSQLRYTATKQAFLDYLGTAL
ncbi:MAG: LytTR family DNA-binding domain-containing protein [Oscillospiraceae bacterium]